MQEEVIKEDKSSVENISFIEKVEPVEAFEKVEVVDAKVRSYPEEVSDVESRLMEGLDILEENVFSYPQKHNTGRKPRDIDFDIFEELCFIQCTDQEISTVFRMDKRAISIKVEEYYGFEYAYIRKVFAEGGKASLRRAQFRLAQKNPALAIWLGKQYLGQKDVPQIEDNKTKNAFDQFNEYIKSLAGNKEESNNTVDSNNRKEYKDKERVGDVQRDT